METSPASGLEATGRRTPRWPRLLLLPLGLAWLVAVPWLGLTALGRSMTFLGEQATAEQLDATGRLLGIAGAVALGLALLGVLASAVARSRASAVIFVVLLLLSVGLSLFTVSRYTAPHPDDPPAHASPTGPPPCQEYSGGDTRCPGG